jgi:hypothetical protein
MSGRKMMAVAALVLAMASVTVLAWDQVNTSVDGLNVKGGTLKIDGTAFTGTAAQLNALVGGTTSSALEPAKILVGNATSNAAAVDVSGGATISTSGVVSVNLSSASTTGILSVAKGGSGAVTFTDGGIILGSGTGAFTALGAASNGQIPIGDGSTDPVLGTITGTSQEIAVANGAGSITLSLGSTFNKTNTYVVLDGNTNAITNIVIILKGQITSWTTNGVSI